MKVMAQFTRESNVRNKLKHSSLLKTVLHYGIAKKMTEVIAILNNYQYDQDVINVKYPFYFWLGGSFFF